MPGAALFRAAAPLDPGVIACADLALWPWRGLKGFWAMSKPTCLNLRSLFGRTYKIRHEESYRAERPEFRKEEEPWLQIIPCVHGHIYPHGGSRLGWSARGKGGIQRQVRQLPFVTVAQDGSDGINATFDVRHFEEVAIIVQPKRRPPKRVLTPEQRAALEKARLKFLAEHPGWKPGQKLSQTDDLNEQGRVRTGRVDQNDHPAPQIDSGASDADHGGNNSPADTDDVLDVQEVPYERT
jgi:hypothetical protein